MKKYFCPLIIIILCLSFVAEISAMDILNTEEMAEQALPYTYQQEMEGLGIDSLSELIKLSPIEIFKWLFSGVEELITEYMISVASVIGVMLITTSLKHALPSSDGGIYLALNFATLFWVIFTISSVGGRVALEGTEAIEQSGLFMLSYIPVFSGVAIASGLPSSALIYHTTLIGVSQVVTQIASEFLAPLLSVYTAISLSGVISGNKALSGVSSVIRKVIIWSLTLTMTVFVGFITLQSFVTGVADLSVSRATKMVIGSFIPVIGGVLSDAISVARSSIVVIKSVVGSIGIAGALIIFAPTLIRLFVWRVVLMICCMIGEGIEATESVRVLTVFMDLTSIVIAIILSVALVFIISTAVILSLGVMS